MSENNVEFFATRPEKIKTRYWYCIVAIPLQLRLESSLYLIGSAPAKTLIDSSKMININNGDIHWSDVRQLNYH